MRATVFRARAGPPRPPPAPRRRARASFHRRRVIFARVGGFRAQSEPAISGMANIKQKISSLGLAEATVHQRSVDAQRSKDGKRTRPDKCGAPRALTPPPFRASPGGVLLMVTGTMFVKDRAAEAPTLRANLLPRSSAPEIDARLFSPRASLGSASEPPHRAWPCPQSK